MEFMLIFGLGWYIGMKKQGNGTFEGDENEDWF